MRWLLTASMLATALPALAQSAPNPANGLELAQTFCQSCHLVSPDQAGPVPDGIPSFMALAKLPGIDSSQIEAALIQPTHPLMPSPPLTAGQMKDVAAYILSLKP